MGRGLAISGFVLSIVGLVVGLFTGAVGAIIGLPISITGLVLSVTGGKKLAAFGEKHGIATAGMVIGIIAVIFTAISFFTCGLCVLCVTGTASAIG